MSDPIETRKDNARSSRHRYRRFVQDYKHRRLDDSEEANENQKRRDDSGKAGGDTPASGSKRALRSKRRQHVREYLRWLWPHRYAVGALFVLALLAAGLELLEPLFMRFIIDKVLLNTGLDAASRLGRLHVAGALFVGVVVLSNLMTVLRDYRQHLVNVRVMLSLRQSLFERLLHLPLPKLWDMKNGEPDKPDARDAPSIVQEIRFENVEFEYRKGQPVVTDFNLVVPGGSVVALVGRSGAGKTTVTDLVARFHDPSRGRILLNGADLRDLRLRTYRDLLAIVQQDVFLFDGSVRDNIAYGRREATDAEIEEAARRANAHEFIVKLPEQYETFIGERGVKLSGGQQQRLAIARAILASPQILILDEATSNLDTESEQLIQASMAALLAGRTTFVIAHRLSTVRRADLILLMDEGRVVERGTHEELMGVGGAYYRMVQRQMESHARDGDEVLR